jgi:Ca2+-binding RTX toxin-like protein
MQVWAVVARLTPVAGVLAVMAMVSSDGRAGISFDFSCVEPGSQPGDIVGDDGTNFLVGTPNPERIFGMGATDQIQGRGGNDVLCGGDGEDILIGNGGADRINGQAGGDYVSYAYAGASGGVDADLEQERGAVSSSDTDIVRSVVNIRGSSGDDTLRGSALTNALVGEGGDDLLQGRGGADLLQGKAGTDNLLGGAGNDHLQGGPGGGDSCNGGPDIDDFGGVSAADSGCETITNIP